MDVTTTQALRSYAAARPATEAQPRSDADFSPGELGRDFAATLRAGEQTALNALNGGADPHALVQALAQTELAVEAAVTVRDRVVEAYQEILRMPV